MRTVICHYHIFKNSGTSFDSLLSDNFDGEPVAFDGPYPFTVFPQEELLKVIRHHPEARAFSSHQIRLPVPVSLEINVLPVVFVRHPLLRIRSVYEYLHRRGGTGNGAVRRLFSYMKGAAYTSRDENRAAQLPFADWVSEALDGGRPLANLSNAQAQQLGGVFDRRSLLRNRPAAEGGVEADLAQAMRNLSAVTLLARTECFRQDVENFAEPLAASGIEFQFRERKPANTTATDIDKPLDERLGTVRAVLGDELYARLECVNRQDLALYDAVCARLG